MRSVTPAWFWPTTLPRYSFQAASSAVVGAVSGAALEKLLLVFTTARDTIARNAHRYDPVLLESLIDFTPLDAEHLQQNIDERHELAALEAKLNRGSLGSARYSLTLQPELDSPERLREYVERHHIGPGWQFLTGARADIAVFGLDGLHLGPLFDPLKNLLLAGPVGPQQPHDLLAHLKCVHDPVRYGYQASRSIRPA